MLSISSEQIEIFLTVAKCGNISMASRLLYFTQPAISTSLKRMEESLHIQLFERTNRGTRLTPAGEKLYAELDPVYNRYRIAINKILSNNRAPHTNMLSIGCLHTPELLYLANEIGLLFQQKHPDILFKSEKFNYHECIEKLLCGELDAVITMSYEATGQHGLESLFLRDIPQYFVIPASWEVGFPDISFLDGKNLILEVNRGIETYRRICENHGLHPKLKYASSFLVLLNAIKNCEGFTIHGNELPLLDSEGIRYIPVRPEPCSERIGSTLIWNTQAISRPLQKLIDICSGLKDVDSQPPQNLI